MREPHPKPCEKKLAACRDPRGQCLPAGRAVTRMVVPTGGVAAGGDDDVTIVLPAVELNLADYVDHDEQGYHVWRFDDSRRWEVWRGQSETSHAIVARRFPTQGQKHVSINREFSDEELPHLIAFLISVYDELEEPPF